VRALSGSRLKKEGLFVLKDFSEFLKWEMTTRDTIDVKKIYIDMAGDVLAGLMLSQIVYWYLPDKYGRSKLRVKKGEHFWIAKKHEDWWEEIRLTPNQARRALRILKEKHLVVTTVKKFNGSPHTHIRIDYKQFMWNWNARLSSICAETQNDMCQNTEL